MPHPSVATLDIYHVQSDDQICALQSPTVETWKGSNNHPAPPILASKNTKLNVKFSYQTMEIGIVCSCNCKLL